MFDALQFINDYNIPFQTKGKNVGRGWVAVNCPFCGDVGFHAAFAMSTGIFNCWRCGGHNTFSTVQAITNLSIHEVKNILDTYGDRNSILVSLNKKTPKASVIELPGGPLKNMHKRYLRKRKFEVDLLEEKYKFQGTDITGEWKYRIIIPVFQNEILVSFLGRDITGEQDLRYKNNPIEKSIVDIKNTLYNEDFVEDYDLIGVCEGSFDAIRMGDGFVATLGTSMSPTQVQRLSKYKKVIFLFDPEKPAQKRAQKYAELVGALGSKVEIVDIGGDKDPGSLEETEVSYIRKELGFGG